VNWRRASFPPTGWRWRCGCHPAASPTSSTDILNGKRGISPETALRLARHFGNSARFWLNLQTAYELAVAEREVGEKVAAEVRPDAA
jgi:plasmid maintenance system antidote protein VapI